MAIALLLALLWSSTPAPHYAELYAHGVPFAEFLDKVNARRDEWRARYRDAVVSPELIQKVRALHGRRQLLVVAEDWCSDSAQTIPYLARLVEAAPGTLEMRIIDSKAGRIVMDAHPTPDGRGATPTIAALTPAGTLIDAWSERPSGLQHWAIEQRKVLSRSELHDQVAKWYADDAGKSALNEIVAILAR